MIAKLLVKSKYIHLANIIMDEMVVPEFIQGQCKSEAIALEVIDQFENPSKTADQVKKLEVVRNKISENADEESPSMKAARYIRYIILGKSKKKAA